MSIDSAPTSAGIHYTARRSSFTTPSPSDRVGGAVLVSGGAVLLAGLLVVPGPDAADVHQATWVPGHALHVAGFLLLAVAMPALARSFQGRLGVVGLVGYAALMVRLVLSAGSHLYSMWTLPNLAAQPALRGQLGNRDHAPLSSIYSAHNVVIGVAIGIGLVGLAFSLWRIGRPMRAAAVGMLIAGLGEMVEIPVALLVVAILGCWLGCRVAIRGDATVALRHQHASARTSGR